MRVYLLVLIILLSLGKLFADINTEFRAVWVITWEHISASSTAEGNKARVRQILDSVKKANMNAVLWQVRQGGTAYYNSSYEPWGYYAGYSYPGYDPLAYAIEQAHLRGLELHAWFNAFHTSAMVPGAPAYEHPEWVCRDGYGAPMPASRALSPGLSEVRNYTLNVAMEIVNNYDIDGLHLDYIRWNEYYRSSFTEIPLDEWNKPELLFQPDGMISPENIEKLETVQNPERYLYDVLHPYDPNNVPGSFPTWEDWWRWTVTEFVLTLHDSIQQVKPWVRLSPAALGKYNWSSWQGYGTVYQDAALWFNEGFVDQLTPMHYHWTTGNEFYGILEGNGTESWGHWIQAGIDSGRIFSVGPGSYRLSSLNLWHNHPQIVQASRTVHWVDGFQFFSYGSWRNHDYWEEAKNLFFQNITKIRAATFLDDQPPGPPVIAGTKINNQLYEIDVTPSGPPIGNEWYAIYRSEDDTLAVDLDEIIYIHFGQNVFTYSDSISGLQNFNGQYRYFATQFDRYWNESTISNSFLSDSIPSFAPMVLETDPMPGDTVPINIRPRILFSKTMDTTSFHGNVEFSPVNPIRSLNWTANLKELTIVPDSNFLNDTEYTLTIRKEVTDINGKQLDGAGNGGSSEDFTLTFYTFGLDIFPPQLIYSHPSVNFYVDNFDVQDLFSFGFNEFLDPNSLQPSSTQVTWSGQTVLHKAMMFDMDDRSVICVQTEEPLYSGHSFEITLFSDITDTSGNALDSNIVVSFETEPFIYQTETIIDNMVGLGYWRHPTYSGSTNGVNPVTSTFDYSFDFYLPAAYVPAQKKSARLHYVWDPAFLDPPGSDYLLREFLDESPPRNVVFGTDVILQCYIFGDGSYNKFRFALDEGNGITWPNHEVSIWVTIDWIGWKLIQWDLSDPDMVGSWIGNGLLDMSSYRIDSFQLTHDSSGAMSGTLYFKDLRVVEKQYGITAISEAEIVKIPQEFELQQNYPNPFNPVTTIQFSVAKSGRVRLTVFNVLGQEVTVLVDEILQPGTFEARLNAKYLASGVYFYELRAGDIALRRRMLLLK